MAQVFASAIALDQCEIDCLHPGAIRPIIGRSLSDDGASAVSSRFGILADPSRARILHLLAISETELCVCDIALVLGMSVSALSHQLRYLRDRTVVQGRKDGRIVFYRLVDDHVRHLVLDAATHAAERVA
jgi:DNA-binding transcriptional ArsR family regulator